MSTKRHAQIDKDFPTRRDENGNRLCRYCQQPVKPPRRTMCSDECVHELRMRTEAGYARAKVFERDKGVCACCGVDTGQMERDYDAEIKACRERCPYHPVYPEYGKRLTAEEMEMDMNYYHWMNAEHKRIRAEYEARGMRLHKHTWEADHINEVVKGGGMCGLDNLQTLCLACHKAKTARLAADRAKARREQKAQAALKSGLFATACQEVQLTA